MYRYEIINDIPQAEVGSICEDFQRDGASTKTFRQQNDKYTVEAHFNNETDGARKTWEYKIVRSHESRPLPMDVWEETILKELGQEGWELAACAEGDLGKIFYFKRLMQTKTTIDEKTYKTPDLSDQGPQEIRRVIRDMSDIINDPKATAEELHAAIITVEEARKIMHENTDLR